MEGRREERRKGIASVTIAPRRHSHDYIRTTIALLLWNIPDIHRPYAVRPLRSKPKRHRKWQTVPRCPPSVPQHKQRTGYASNGKSPPTTNCSLPRQPPAGREVPYGTSSYTVPSVSRHRPKRAESAAASNAAALPPFCRFGCTALYRRANPPRQCLLRYSETPSPVAFIASLP